VRGPHGETVCRSSQAYQALRDTDTSCLKVASAKIEDILVDHDFGLVVEDGQSVRSRRCRRHAVTSRRPKPELVPYTAPTDAARG